MARGFRFHGSRCGIRPDPQRKDLALIVSDVPAAAAGVFTQARIVAAPVQVSRSRLPAADVRGVVVCSGNANACTGRRGLDDARRMAALAAEALGCRPEQFLVCSTGVIGRPLPMAVIEPGIFAAALHLHSTAEALDAAAHAILTTDTHIKVSTRAVPIGGREVRLTGLAKGAAMIAPNLATMLAFLLTDAAVHPADLHALLRQSADRTFNCISVDGHASTNDTVLLMANGAAGGEPLSGSDLQIFAQQLDDVCEELAQAIVNDGEGSTHLVAIAVEGLPSDADARRVARSVADSVLVKTAIFGGDPNWGRIVSAAGNSGIEFGESELSCWVGPHLLYDRGMPQDHSPDVVASYLKNNRCIDIRLQFQSGSGRCRFWTTDLTYEYVRLNAEYTT